MPVLSYITPLHYLGFSIIILVTNRFCLRHLEQKVLFSLVFFFLVQHHFQNLFIVNFCRVSILPLLSPFASLPLCSTLPSPLLILSLPPSFFPSIHPIYLPLCSRFLTILPHMETQALVTWLLLCWARRVVICAQGFPANPASACDLFKEKAGWRMGGAQVTLCPQTLHVSDLTAFPPPAN